MIRTPIKRGQIWESKKSGIRCRIFGSVGGRWRVITLNTDKIQNHSITNNTIWSRMKLIK